MWSRIPDQASRLRGHFGAGDGGGLAETDDAGDVFGAGTQSGLLPTAFEQRRQLHTGSRVESSHAFGTMQFVRGDGE